MTKSVFSAVAFHSYSCVFAKIASYKSFGSFTFMISMKIT